jgi:hypothetical protein
MSNQLSDTKQLPLILPEPQPADLLEQLAEDSQTEGLARLTQRLIAALKIPMQSRSNSDQSFGGVSDITNRGNFDRLLLSELAHDDLSLMARLANNEALYLRREELPANHTRQRFILVDTSIKMWGTPRIFAIATALACRVNNKDKTRVSTFALQGNAYSEIELLTKSDIIGALAELSPALHSAGALTAFAKEHTLGREQEYFLITDEQLFYTPAFQAAFAHLRTAHGFLITVNRSGQLQLFKYKAGNRRLLHNISLDLPELLSKAKKVINTKKEIYDRKDLPAFFRQDPVPLYFPSSKILPDKEHMFSAFGVIGIAKDQRLLYWPEKTTGAIELMSFILPGNYYFGQDEKSIIYILLHIPGSPHILRLLQVDTKLRTITTIDCKHEIMLQKSHAIVFYQKHFIIDSGDTVYTINPANGNIYMREGKEADLLVLRPLNTEYEFNAKEIKRTINNGYNTLNHIQQIFIDGDYLMLDNRSLVINDKTNSITLKKPVHNYIREKISAVSENPIQVSIPEVNYKLSKFTWENGCEAFLDSRGLLHLRAPNLPEVTILLILNRSIACWASDGATCGTEYFIGKHPEKKMPVQEFYKKYIQSFIEALK